MPSSSGGTTYAQLVELDSPSSQSQYAYVGVSASCTPVVGGLGLQESVTPSVFSDVGEALTFTFTVTNTGAFPLNNVEAVSGVATLGACAPIALPGTLAPGASTTCTARYTVAAADMAGGCIANPVTASATTNTGSTAAGSATAEACLSSDKTRRAIGKFISRRTDLLASNDPDNTSGLRRFATGGGAGSQPITAAANGDARNGSVVVASSLSQMIAASRASGDAQRMALGAGSDTDGDTVRAPVAAGGQPDLDVWIEGHYQRWQDSSDAGAGTSGDFGILYAGVDYRLGRDLIVGVMAQSDWMSDRDAADGLDISGTGWMLGPYMAARLSDQLFFDARAAWGRSSNEISPFGTYVDTFETERWLAKANLTGNWQFGSLRVSPSVGVTYVEETQQAYVDTPGLRIDGQTARLGRLSFGPEFGYTIQGSDGTVYEPFASLTGMWDFERENSGALAGNLGSGDDLRAKAEVGLTVRGESGAALRAAASYDGIGDNNFEAWGGQLWVNVPLDVLDDMFAAAAAPNWAAPWGVGGEPGQDAAGGSTTSGLPPGSFQIAQAALEEDPAAAEFELPAVVVESEKAKQVRRKKRKPAPATASSGGSPGPVASSPAGPGSAGQVGGDTANAAGEGSGLDGEGAGSEMASRNARRGVEQVTNVEEVTAEQIMERGARTLDEALDLVPGLYTRNAADGVPRIDIRGMRTRNIQLLLDGVPLNSTFDGQFDPRALPVENISRIKITKGASSVLYGPGGNAAVIDIITKGAARGTHGSVTAEWSPERGHSERVSASHGSETVRIFMSGSNLDQDSFDLSDDFAPTAQQPGKERLNSDRRDQSLYANLLWSPTQAAQFGMSVDWRTGEYGKVPSTVSALDSIFAQRVRYERVEDYENLSVQASALVRINRALSIRPTAYYNTFDEQTEAYDDDTYSTQVVGRSFSEDATTNVTGAGAQIMYRMGESLLTVAVDGKQESWESSGFEVPCLAGRGREPCQQSGVAVDFETRRTVETVSVAAEQELKFSDQLTAVVGAGYAEQYKGVESDDDYTYLFGTRYLLTDTTALRGSVARKIRFPTLRDLFSRDGGNPDLETEITDNYEVAVEQDIPALSTFFTVALYRTDAENFIERQNNVFSNVDRLRLQGVETSVRFTGIDGLTLDAGYTYLDAENRTPDSPTTVLQQRPEHKFTLAGAYRFDWGMTLSADLLYIDGSKQLAGGGGGGGGGGANAGEVLALDDYTVVNAGIAQTIPGTGAELYGRVENVFDKDYVESFGFEQPGRTFYGGVRAKF